MLEFLKWLGSSACSFISAMVGLGSHQEAHVRLLLSESAESIALQLTSRDTRIERLEQQLRTLEKKAIALEIASKELSFYNHLMQRRIDDLDQYSRRLNVIVRGLTIRPNESPITIRAAILREIKKQSLDIQDIEVSRAHRHGEQYYDINDIKQQACIVRFISWRARDVFFQARKASQYFVSADITPRRSKVFAHARSRSKEAEVAKVFDFVLVDKNCKMTAKCGNKFLGFSSIMEFETLLTWAEADKQRWLKDVLTGHDNFGRSNMEKMEFTPPVILPD